MDAIAKTSGAAYGWVAVLAVTVFACAWTAAYSAETSWVWGTSRLENFGISTTKDVAHLFNYGCILTGILLAVYGAGKTTFDDNVGCGVSAIFTALAGTCIVFIGVFTKDYYNGNYLHFFACLTAAFVAVSLIAEAAGLWKCGKIRRVFAGIGVIIALTVAVAYFTLDFPKFEAYAVTLALVWFCIDAITFIGARIKAGKTYKGTC